MPTQIYSDETEVVPLLTKMKLPRWAMLELASKVAGERANISPDDPPTAAGYETWRWGTRFAREDGALKDLGWTACEKDQISGIRNAHIGVKLVVCNTDYRTGNPLKTPRNITGKGPASCRLIDANGRQLRMQFMRMKRSMSFGIFAFSLAINIWPLKYRAQKVSPLG